MVWRSAVKTSLLSDGLHVNSLEKNRLGSGESSFGVGNRRERLGLNPGKHKDTIIFDSSGGTTG